MARVRTTRRDLVLDVGSGSFPHSQADVLVERFIEDTEGHRGHKELVRDRPVVCADIHALPFRDRAIDYVICNHVLEHVEDPIQALRELARVGKRGFLAVPSEFYEFLCPTPTHRWVFALAGETLLMKPKQDRHNFGLQMYGGVFHQLYGQADFRRLAVRRPQLFNVALEWANEIPYQYFRDDKTFEDYYDPQVIAHLINPVPADGLSDSIRQWFHINLDLSQEYQLAKVRGLVRRLVKGAKSLRLLPSSGPKNNQK